MDVLEAGQVTAYDDEVQVLVVLAREVEQRPAARGQHLEVEPRAACGEGPVGEGERVAVGAGSQTADVSDGRRVVVVAVPGCLPGVVTVVGRAVVGHGLGVDRTHEPAPAPRDREGGGESGDERDHAQRRTHAGVHARA